MSITVSFTPEQFAALKDLLDYSEDDESRWARESFDYEEEDTDTPEMILKKLVELGADKSPYGNIQRTRIAMQSMREREDGVEEPLSDILQEKIDLLEREKDILFRYVSDKDLAKVKEELTEVAQWMKNREEEDEDEHDEDYEDKCPGNVDDYDWIECCDTKCKYNGHWFLKEQIEYDEDEEDEEDDDKEEKKWRAMIDGVAQPEEEEEKEKAIFTREKFIERMNDQEQSSKDLAQSIYARTPKSKQAEMAKLLETDLSWDKLASMLYDHIPEDELAQMAEEEFCDKCGVMLEDDCEEEGLCNWCAK